MLCVCLILNAYISVFFGFTETKCYLQQFVLCNKIDLLSALILLCLLISKKDSRVIKDVVLLV